MSSDQSYRQEVAAAPSPPPTLKARLTALRRHKALLLAAIPAIALLAGLAAMLLGRQDLAGWIWIAGIAPVFASLAVAIVKGLARGIIGLDIIAALAMGGAVAGNEPLAGVVVALMFAGGQALEDYAQSRASSEMTALLGRVARFAQVYRDGRLVQETVEALMPGDRILVRTGDIVPADGILTEGEGLLDESALTGEPMPVRRYAGGNIESGVVNAGPPFDLDVSRRAAESTYAGIVRMVEAARLSKAPMARLADRYAIGFLAATILLAGGAWLISGDPIRALAVLVVATPCPLILAVPVAVVAGMSRCARNGVMIKTARAIETLARVRTVLLDKTGTVTEGHPGVLRVEPADTIGEERLVALAACLAQASHHVISQAIVDAARRRGLPLTPPTSVNETAGEGVAGIVEGAAIRIGRRNFVIAGSSAPPPHAWSEAPPPGCTAMHVSVDGIEVGRILFADRLRADAFSTLQALRGNGVKRIVLLTGDRAEVAERVGAELQVDTVIADATPEHKVATAKAERGHGPTMMVGDGINDAPVLAYADIGVALGARGAVAASEAADMVVMVDNFGRIAEAMTIARRTRAIALQSVLFGIGLSLLCMVVAAFGYLPPVLGALIQEVIDLAVVLNALRALGGGAKTD